MANNIEKDINKLKGDSKIPLRILLVRVWKYIKVEWRAFLVAFILVGLAVFASVVLPILQGEVVNNLKGDNPVGTVNIIINILIGYVALTIINGVFTYFENMSLQKAGQRIIYRLRNEVFEHIENMSLNQINEMPVGSLVTRVATYTTNMSDLFTNVLVNFVKNFLMIFGILIALYIINVNIAVVVTGVAIIVFLMCYFFSKELKKTFKKEHGLYSDVHTYLNENLSGMQIIQNFGQQQRKLEDFDKINTNLRKTRYRIVILFALNRPAISLFYYCTLALIFFFVTKDWLKAGEVVSVYVLFSHFFRPIETIADQLNNFQRAITSSERLFNLLDVKPEQLNIDKPFRPEKFEGRIEFKHVWFAYKGEDWILKDVSFVVEPKQTIALVGATGSGKTTILSLIVRNYDVQKGEVLIDGMNVKDIDIEYLRRGIGQMLQDVFLFTGTIKNNVSLFDQNISDEEVVGALKYVDAYDFVSKKEEGINYEIREGGVNLSQGQKQLISFARTILSKPQILILDEATANIDTETEITIQNSLQKMKSIGTMIVVAHRLSTIQHSDQILVLNKGEIIERGNHQELLHLKGYYYKLYRIQFDKEK